MGHNSVANLWRMIIYNLNLDFVYDNVFTKLVSISLFGLKILKNLFLMSIEAYYSVANLGKMTIYYPKRRSCQ